MGLSAALLRRHPVDKLPELDKIWNDNPDDIGYPVSISRSTLHRFRGSWFVQCVTAILGATNPRDTYNVFNAQTWRKAVDRQWDHSGLPNALRRLTSDLVAQAKQRVLAEEGRQFQKQVHKIIVNQQYAWCCLFALCFETDAKSIQARPIRNATEQGRIRSCARGVPEGAC